MKNEIVENNTDVSTYPHESLQHIEDARAEFLRKYKVHDLLKKVVFGICFGAMVFCLLVAPNVWKDGGSLSQVVQLGIPLISMGVMLAYGIVVKKMMDVKMREYFKTYYNCINEYSLSLKGISNVVLEEPGKISIEDFTQNQIHKNIYQVGSRGLTAFTFNKMNISIVDCAAQIKGERRVLPVFVGKYLISDSSYKEKEPIIVYLKGEGTVLPPTNIEDKKVVLDNSKLVIYSNSKNWKTALSVDVMKRIEAIKTDKLLVDYTISLVDGKQFICMGYDDPIMVPPLQNKFDSKPNEQFKNDLEVTLNLMEALK